MMKIVMQLPSERTLTPIGETIELVVHVTDNGAGAANTLIKWTAIDPESRLASAETVTDAKGMARNRLTVSSKPTPLPRHIFITTPDRNIHKVCDFVVVSGELGGRVLLSPFSGTVFAAPPMMPQPRTTGASGNKLTIVYPDQTNVMPWLTTVCAWVLYVDRNGKGIPGKVIRPSSQDLHVYSPPEYSTTNEDGWAPILLAPIGVVNGDGPPGKPSELYANLQVQVDGYTDQKSLHFSTSAGGPGSVGYQLGIAQPVRGEWTFLEVYLKNVDGTPAKFRAVNWSTAGSSKDRVEISTPVTVTNHDGVSNNFFRVPDGNTDYPATIVVSSPNALRGAGIVTESVFMVYPQNPSAARPTGSMYIVSEDGQNLQYGPYHNLQVRFHDYVPPDGTVITWLPLSQGTSMAPLQTKVLSGRSTTTILEAPFPGYLVSQGAVLASCPWAWPNPEQGHYVAGASLSFRQPVVPLEVGTAQEGEILLISADGDTLTQNEPHVITVHYYGASVFAGVPVTWRADPPGHIKFEYPYPTTTTKSGFVGVGTIKITCVGTEDVGRVTIYAQAPNPLSGRMEEGNLSLVFRGQGRPPSDDGTLTIAAVEPQPLTLYAYHTLTASYTHTDGGSAIAGRRAVFWTADPDPDALFDFSPNPSYTDDQGRTTTLIAGNGNQGLTAHIHARVDNPFNLKVDLGEADITFKQPDAPAPPGTRLALRSVEGTVLWVGKRHLIRATYTRFDGTPLKEQTVTWKIDPSGKVGLATLTSQTDSDGVAINELYSSSTFTDTLLPATITGSVNLATGDAVTGELGVVLSGQPVPTLPGAGFMSLKSRDPTPLETNKYHELTVTYLGEDWSTPESGKEITWSAFPADRVSFGTSSTTPTNDNGVAVNTVFCRGDEDLSNVLIMASTFNPTTGMNDPARLSVDFQYVAPVGLTGVLLDKAYAANPPILSNVDPKRAAQVIRGEVRLSGQSGAQKILLSTEPVDSNVVMFDKDGQELPQLGSNYTVTTNSDTGVAQFLVGGRNPELIKLSAKWPATGAVKDQVSTNLVIATISDDFGGGLIRPNVHGLISNGSNSTLPIGAGPTFTVTIATIPGVANYQLVLMLNDRIAYVGKMQDAFPPNNRIEIAYAMLRPKKNTIAYLMANSLSAGPSTQESDSASFDASGSAQTEPAEGLTRVLPAPQIDGPEVIGPADILNGLSATILPSSTFPYAAGDIITAYFYLSGQDAASVPIRNIAVIQRKLTPSDDLANGLAAAIAPVSQMLLAGYGGTAGKLAVDFKVVRGFNVWWSAVTYRSLNTVLKPA